MKLGYLISDTPGHTNHFLGKLAHSLMDQGHAVAGAVQKQGSRDPSEKCAMLLEILPTGQEIQISKNLGQDATGCRLDGQALVEATTSATSQLNASTDVLIINKFDKQENVGGGFRDLIVSALEREIPVILGVSHGNLDAFLEFAGGMASQLNTSEKAVLDWFHAQRKAS